MIKWGREGTSRAGVENESGAEREREREREQEAKTEHTRRNESEVGDAFIKK
jgi:hypothetical protein